MRTPLSPLTVTPHQRRHNQKRIVKDALSNSAYVPCCDCGAMVEVVYGLVYAQSHHIRCCNCKHAARDRKRAAATCPICEKPMMECRCEYYLTLSELEYDYCKQNKAAAKYMQAPLFDREQMAALSPEAARYQRRKVERE